MLEKIKRSKLLFWSIELLVVATLILVSTQIGFVFQPIGTFFSTLFAPVLIAGFLYYMLNPLVQLLIKKAKLKKNVAVALVMLLLLGAVVILFVSVLPQLAKQISSLAKNLPSFVKGMEAWGMDMLQKPMFKDLDVEQYMTKFDISMGTVLKQIVDSLSSGFGSLISSIASMTIVVITVPFILFYMLKDGHRLVPSIEKYLPKKPKKEIVNLLEKMSRTISTYISGQAIECLFVALATFIGYQLIGIEYAFLFGCIAGATNMIPYIGPYIGLAPAVLVTVFDTPMKAVLACVVVLIVQQVDGNVIYPLVIGKSLDIHPLTIILILLVAGNIAGLLGMILGVPFYAVCKTIFTHIFDIMQLKNKDEEEVLLVSENTDKQVGN